MDRIDRIYARTQEMKKTWQGLDRTTDRINLLRESGFTEMSYMKRRARTIEAVLDDAWVRLFPDELLAGSFLRTFSPYINSTLEERRKYSDMNLAFPRRNNHIIDGQEFYSSKALRLTEAELENPDSSRWDWGHSCGGYPRILEMGYQGIIDDAKARIAAMDAAGEENIEKRDFYEAVITTVSAVLRYAQRHVSALEEAAAAESDETRKAELLQMAAHLRHVPANPPRTFWEALQSVWFAYICNIRFSGSDFGRFDQYMYPFYKHDIDAGILTKEQAQELIDCLFLKCDELQTAIPSNAGLPPPIMLGGLRPDGVDGTNDVTIMCLLATERLKNPAPKLSVRINEQTPDIIFEIAHRMLLAGINQPDFYSDRNMIAAFERRGIPFEDACQYAQSICEEISLAGISEDVTNEGPHCDVHDKVKIAMERVSAGESADTFEDFLAMVEEEIRKCIREEIEFCEEQTEKLRTFNPQPLHSAAIVGCLESGKDITAGGAKYNNTGSVIGGLACASDGLYAIKNLCYDRKRLTISEFYEILKADYEGNELLRVEILNKFPKFGNDDDRVDAIAARLFDVYADELESHKNSRGGVYKVGAWASEYRSSYMATPDGRCKGDTFATNISPTPGRDLKGVTAAIRSGTKIRLGIACGGSMLDIAMNPSCIRGENGVEVLKQILTTYGTLGGIGMQFNIVDAEMLKDAMENPEKYRNLMVRVWGYNDYFTALTKFRQKHIINRTMHGSL